MRITWNDDDVEKLRSLIAAGKTYTEIGAAFGTGRSAIAARIFRMRLANDSRIEGCGLEETVARNIKNRGKLRAAERRRKMADLAALLAEGASIFSAAHAMGLPNDRAEQLFARICKELGRQAA